MYNNTTPGTWNATNTTAAPQNEHDETYHFVSTLFVAVLSIIITIANIIVIVTYWFAKKIRGKTANLLLCDQAVVDLYNGIVVGGMTVFGTGNTPQLLVQSIYQLSIGFSIHTILLISIERCIFILKPLFHRSSITKRRMLVGIAVSWLLSFIWLPLRLVNWHDSDEKKAYKIFIAVSDSYILLLIVTVGCLHALTYRAVKRFIMHRYHDLLGARRTPAHQENIRVKQHMKEIRVSKIFIAMFVAFIFTYIPVFLTGIIFITEVYKQFPPSAYKYFSLDLIFYLCNSVCNPLITLVFKEDYRKNLRLLFTTMHSLTIFTRQYTLTRRQSSTTSSNWRKTLMTTIQSTVKGTPERKRRSTALYNKRFTNPDFRNAESNSSTPEIRRRGVEMLSAEERRRAFAMTKLHGRMPPPGEEMFHFTQVHHVHSSSKEHLTPSTGNRSSSQSSYTSSSERLLATQPQSIDVKTLKTSPLVTNEDVVSTSKCTEYAATSPMFTRAAKYKSCPTNDYL